MEQHTLQDIKEKIESSLYDLKSAVQEINTLLMGVEYDNAESPSMVNASYKEFLTEQINDAALIESLTDVLFDFVIGAELGEDAPREECMSEMLELTKKFTEHLRAIDSKLINVKDSLFSSGENADSEVMSANPSYDVTLSSVIKLIQSCYYDANEILGFLRPENIPEPTEETAD